MSDEKNSDKKDLTAAEELDLQIVSLEREIAVHTQNLFNAQGALKMAQHMKQRYLLTKKEATQP